MVVRGLETQDFPLEVDSPQLASSLRFLKCAYAGGNSTNTKTLEYVWFPLLQKEPPGIEENPVLIPDLVCSTEGRTALVYMYKIVILNVDTEIDVCVLNFTISCGNKRPSPNSTSNDVFIKYRNVARHTGCTHAYFWGCDDNTHRLSKYKWVYFKNRSLSRNCVCVHIV